MHGRSDRSITARLVISERALGLAVSLVLVASGILLAWVPCGAVAAPARRSAKPATSPLPAVQDRWTRIAPGIRYVHRTTKEPVSAHILEVDLRAPGVTVEVTSYKRRWLTTSQYARTEGAVAAINGGFWSVFDSKAEGLVMHGGEVWPGARDDELFGFFAITQEGRAIISPASEVVRGKKASFKEAISGLQRILHQGKVTREAFCQDGCRFRNPRTAVGVSADGNLVFLAVVDGRTKVSRGLSLRDLAAHLADLGAWNVINLDGGGSAAFYLATQKGLVSRPADRRERSVLNHIGAFWRPTQAELKAWQALRAAEESSATSENHPGSPAAVKSSTPPLPADPGEPGSPAGDLNATGHGARKELRGSLPGPPVPSTAGVPTGLSRLLQRGYREWLSPRNLLVGALGLGLLTLVLLGRRRKGPRR